MKLRPYQYQLIDDIRKSLVSGKRRVCAVLGCGGGKSVIQAAIAYSATAKGNRVLFLVHRKELRAQIEATFASQGVDFSLCTVGMVQTITRRIKEMAAPSLILVDEAHHALSGSYLSIFAYWPKATMVGFTATPARMNEGGLGGVFEELITSVSTKWLIENKYLAPYIYYGVTLTDTSKLRIRAGEYVKEDVEKLMNKSAIFGNAVINWKKYADGKKTIVYCASIETSKNTTKAFTEAGVNAAHLDAKTPTAERERIVRMFRQGEITLLSNVDLFGEGFDVPDCEAVILLRPTKSLTLHIQQSMRSMRYKEGKTAIILDHVGNYARHGLPDDERTWSLEAKKKREKNEVKVKTCPNCFSVVSSAADKCPNCGLVFEKPPANEMPKNKVIEDIILEQIKNVSFWEYKNCKTWDELETFRSAKKYNIFWSFHKADELGIEVPPKYQWLKKKVRGKWGK